MAFRVGHRGGVHLMPAVALLLAAIGRAVLRWIV
jgi:hypothetical protein